jgi:monoamine oxidase
MTVGAPVTTMIAAPRRLIRERHNDARMVATRTAAQLSARRVTSFENTSHIQPVADSNAPPYDFEALQEYCFSWLATISHAVH